MSGYLFLALPLLLAGQVALGFDFGARVFAFLGRRWNKWALILVFWAVPTVALWTPWLAALVRPDLAETLRARVWAHGAAGGALFLLYVLAPLPGISRRPSSVANLFLDMKAFRPAGEATHRDSGTVLEIRRDRLTLPGGRGPEGGVSLGVISDLHLYAPKDLPFVRWCVEQLNALEPDLCVALGDLTLKEEMVGSMVEVLEALQAPLGTFACLGNHDLKLGAEHAEEALRNSPVAPVRPGSGEVEPCPGLALAATEWPFGDLGDDLSRKGGADGAAGRLRVLLAHSPDVFGMAARAGFDLVLSGHTHGGFPYLPRFGPLIAPLRYGRGLAEGWFRKGGTHLFVSRGVGYVMSKPTARRPQIACIEIALRTDGPTSAAPSETPVGPPKAPQTGGSE